MAGSRVVVTPAALEYYRESVRQLAFKYSECWLLRCKAEDAGRAEHLSRIRRRMVVGSAQPKLGGKAHLLTRNQIIEHENSECHGGLRNPRNFVRGSSRAQKLGARLRKALEKARRIPDVRWAMGMVV